MNRSSSWGTPIDLHKFDYLHAEGVKTVEQARKQFVPGCTCRACKVIDFLDSRQYVVFIVFPLSSRTCGKCGAPMSFDGTDWHCPHCR